ncbi:MAG: lamin tail domain-containing protein, partial [Bacteroidota bacterium]
PDGTSGSFTVSVASGSESQTFSFTPVDNATIDEDKMVTFTITTDSDAIDLGSSVTLTVTITEDDGISIAEARAATGVVTIQGTVITPDYGFSNGQYYIQDATGGINVFHSGSQGLVSQGDLVQIVGEIGSFADQVQISPDGENPVTVISQGNALPSAATLDEAGLTVDNSLQGTLVTISGVSITENQWPVEAISSGSNHDVDAMVGATAFFITIDRGESFYDGSAIPGEPLTVTGVLARDGDDVQILPFNDGDIVAGGTAPSLMISGTLADFGQVANGGTSTEQNYMVTGAELDNDIVVTAPNGFEISTTSGSGYVSNLTLTAAEANAGQTIYVVFKPASGANQTFNGSITHMGDDILTQTIDVTGEETGNGAVSAPTDLFFSEYVEGSSNNKYLEIYNGTGAAIDLSDYQINRYGNGSSDISGSYVLAGTLNDGEVVVIANNSATVYTGTVYDATDANGATFYNGDDVVELYKISTATSLDIIGQIGCDPGSAWSEGSHSTQNKTLRRKSTVNAGVGTNPTGDCDATSFTTLTTEWDVLDQDDVSGLGSHTFGN